MILSVKKPMKIFYISKAEDERIACGIVMQGTPPDHEPILDSQSDWISMANLQRAARKFMIERDSFCFDVNHGDQSRETFSFPILESYVVEEEEGILKHGKRIPQAAWLMTIKITDDSVWQQVKSGRLDGFSISGISEGKET